MTTSSAKFNRATKESLCNLLGSGAAAAASAFTYSLVVPGTPINGAAAALAGVSSLAYAYGCQFDPDKPNPYPPGEGGSGGKCWKIQEGQGQGNLVGVGTDGREFSSRNPCVEILSWTYYEKSNGEIVKSNASVVIRPEWGGPTKTVTTAGTPEVAYVYMRLDDDQDCAGVGPEAPPEIPPYKYTDPVDNCEINVQFLGMGFDSNNNLYPAWQLEPAETLKSGGGVIGGCNFSPTVYTQNPSPPGGDPEDPDDPDGPTNPPGPPLLPPAPLPPDPGPGPNGEPWWMELVRETVAGVTANIISDKIQELFEKPVASGEWEMIAPCNKNAEGQPETISQFFPEEEFQTAVLDRLDSIPGFLGQHLAWRTPTCNEQPEVEGEYVTIEFISDDPSPNGPARLRKLFRYRSSSGIGLGELADYWKDFSWSAGPVCVKHTGGTWGAPQCWASSGDEGKRLIRHAAAEAGIDPDKTGRWEISGSNNPRYGMPGTMRVRINRGTYCITNRLGSDGRPYVVEV